MNRQLHTAWLLLCVVGLAQAQQPTPPDTSRVVQKPEIIVTSTRTMEPLTKVPMAISTVTSDAFQTGRRYELKDALWGVPGVLTQARSGHTDLRITIRGYGARGAGNRSNAGNMRGIRVLVDGIPETEPDGRTSLDLVNLDAVSHLEVLRSNSSTLYGSASGGVISLFTNLDFAEPFAETKNVVGSFNFMRNTVSAGTIAGNTRIFASVSNTTYGNDTNRTYRDHSGASQLLATFGLRSQLDASTKLGVYASATSNLFRFPGPLTFAQFEADLSQANSTFVRQDERRWNRQGKVGITLDHDFNGGHSLGGSVFLQPKVLERSERNSYRDFNRYGVGGQAQYRWETNFGEAVASRFTAGFDQQYQDGTVLFYNLRAGGSRGQTLSQNKQEGALTLGGYAEETVTLNDQWTIKVGGRYDHIRYFFRNFFDSLSSIRSPQEKVFKKFTPKAGISYKLAEGYSIYGTIGGGVEAPAYNEVDPPPDSLIRARGGEIDTVNRDFNPLLEPTNSTSFEIGTRGVVGFDGPLSYVSYDVAAYMIQIKNDLVPWSGGRYYFTAAETERTGLEVGLSAGTNFGLMLQSAMTFGSNKYDKYENLLGKFDGNDQAGLPGMYGNARLRYTASFGAYIEGGLEFVGEYYADDRNDKKTDGSPDTTVNSLAPGYSLLGVAAGWKGEVGPFGLDLYAAINNLADTKYISSVFINGENNQYFEPGMPRNIVVGVGIRYH